MSFDVDVGVRLGDTTIACKFRSDAPVTALLGPSGVGKSTVLNMIAGLIEPGWGRIIVNGKTLSEMSDDPWLPDLLVPAEQRRAGYVFQDARLFPHLTVRDNLTYGGGAIDARIDFLGIGHLLDRWPRTLSGGEARRVAIGRALLSDPAFLLLDEPLSSLDRARREEVMVALEHLRDHAGLPMLLVTHDRAEAERLGGQIVELG